MNGIKSFYTKPDFAGTYAEFLNIIAEHNADKRNKHATVSKVICDLIAGYVTANKKAQLPATQPVAQTVEPASEPATEATV